MFRSTEECQKAFDELKKILCSSPILAFPNETDMFVVDTDASAHSIGAVLSQVQDGHERVIAYGIKSLANKKKTIVLHVVIFCQSCILSLSGDTF